MRVLVAEENPKLARFIERALSEEGYAVDRCAGGPDALLRARASHYDVVLLGRTIPEIDGIEVSRRLREGGSVVPIIMTSALDSVSERVRALDSGVDDYVVKPFEIAELLARIRALLRRATGQTQLRFGPLEIDRVDRRILVGGRALELTTREFELLLHFAHRGERVVTRSELLTQVWSVRFDPESNVIEAQIRRLRDKLGRYAWMIETVRGRGYRLRTSHGDR